MCQGCFDDAGQPMIREPAVIVVALAAKALNESGALHVILDDWNVDDSNIESCMKADDLTEAEAAWLVCFSALDGNQRLSAMALADGYWTLEGGARHPVGETTEIPPDLLARMRAN